PRPGAQLLARFQPAARGEPERLVGHVRVEPLEQQQPLRGVEQQHARGHPRARAAGRIDERFPHPPDATLVMQVTPGSVERACPAPSHSHNRPDEEEDEMDRADGMKVVDEPISRRLLMSDVPARLAYTAVDGDPRVVPIGFWWNGEELVICTAPAAAKVRALQQNPRVAITIDHLLPWPPRVLLIRG